MESSSKRRSELQQAMQALKTLKDEIALKLHLASMDARDTWASLSGEIDRVTHEVSDASHEVVNDLIERVRRFSHALDRERGTGPRDSA